MKRRLFTILLTFSLVPYVNNLAMCAENSVPANDYDIVSVYCKALHARYTLRANADRIGLYGPPMAGSKFAKTHIASERVSRMLNAPLRWQIYEMYDNPEDEKKGFLWVQRNNEATDSPLEALFPPSSREVIPPALEAMEDPRRFAAAHCLLMNESISFETPEPLAIRDGLARRPDGSILYYRGGLRAELLQVEKTGSGVAVGGLTDVYSCRISIDPNQFPTLRARWHRRLDKPAAVCPTSVCVAGAWQVLGPRAMLIIPISIIAMHCSTTSGQTISPNPSEAQELAAAQILQLGGTIETDAKDPSRPIISVRLSPYGRDDTLVYVKALTNLRTLDLSYADITDAGLEHLNGLNQLQELDLGVDASDAGLASLKGLINLKTLDLSHTKVNGTGLKGLKGLAQLRKLDLSSSAATDAGLESLKGLTQLQTLDLSHANVGDAGLHHMTGLTHLEVLSLRDTQVTDAGLESLKGLTQLHELILSGTRVTDAGLGSLKGLTHLQTLMLSDTKVTDAGLENLKGLVQLRRLVLADTKVTAQGAQDLMRALPNCKLYPTFQ